MVLKELISNISYFGRYGGFQRMDFNSFYFKKSVVVLKELILIVSTLGGCGGLE